MSRFVWGLLIILPLGCAADGSETDARLGQGGEGNLSLEWSISDGDQAISCTDAGAVEIEIVALGSEAEVIETISCFGGVAETNLIPAGVHDVTARLTAADGTVLAQVACGEMTVEGGFTTPIGAVEFELSNLRRDHR